MENRNLNEYEITPNVKLVEVKMGVFSESAFCKSQEDLERLYLRIIRKGLEKYVKSRENAYRYAGRLNRSRIRSCEIIKYRLSRSNTWSLPKACEIVLRSAGDLYSILPNSNSRYFKNSEKFLTDVMDFSKSQLKTESYGTR